MIYRLRSRMLLGYTTRERLNTFVHDIIENSLEKDHIRDVFGDL